MSVRLEAGGITEDVEIDGVGAVPVRHERCPAGWQTSFSVSHPDAGDLAVAHRFVSASLHEARATLPVAVAFLLGCPVDEPLVQL